MAQKTPYELSNKTETATYSEIISYYSELDKKYEQMKIIVCGQTDIGIPLNLVILSRDKIFDAATLKKHDKRVLLINNGIHPGEPEGTDASMMLARDLLSKDQLPENVVICIIPVYNIDGCLNRGISRVNQNGPNSYGFRGNYQNLALNRDFIKTDSRNSRSFQEIFNTWDPEVFVDNHTSNGSDYQYGMTLIPTQKDKLNPVLSEYLTQTMLPHLYETMKAGGHEMIPYVNNIGESPDSGITGFLETARYSTGYAALHNTIGFMPETHMLKPFSQRVESTYAFMQSVIGIVERDSKIIAENRRNANKQTADQRRFALNWQLDESSFENIMFKGYEAEHKPNEVSGLPRLFYNRNRPFEKEIKVYDDYKPSVAADKPAAYIIPQAWQKVISLLNLNGVKMKQLSEDSEIEVESYYIADYKTSSRPFEGHYLHSNVQVNKSLHKIKFYAGDYVVYTNQIKNRNIVETLEPQGVDSFFAWNFFDSILGQKEHFSDYVFEDVAAELIKKDPELKAKLEAEKLKNLAAAKSADAQLEFIYKNSIYSENSFMRYPVGRLISDTHLPLH